MNKLLMALALALTITACSPQEKVTAIPSTQPQVTATESLFIANLPVVAEVKKAKANPKIVKAKPAAKKPKVTKKPVVKTSSVESNIAAHLVKYKVSKGNASNYAALIVKHSKTYGTNPYTILAMMQVETGATFNPNLVGTHNDTGLLQILPATQRYMGISGNLFDPSINIEIGTKYLAYCQKRFGNDLGIVAYNQGEGNVKRGTYNTKYLTRVNSALATIRS